MIGGLASPFSLLAMDTFHGFGRLIKPNGLKMLEESDEAIGYWFKVVLA
jgi:hypothetical protein